LQYKGYPYLLFLTFLTKLFAFPYKKFMVQLERRFVNFFAEILYFKATNIEEFPLKKFAFCLLDHTEIFEKYPKLLKFSPPKNSLFL
jgi:hypothetical protein